MDYTFLLVELENILGKGIKRARDNYAFHCPFCNHKKPKLEVKLLSNENGENPWECWVCETRGLTIYSLLKQLKLCKEDINKVLKYVKKGNLKLNYRQKEELKLPKEFKYLHKAPDTSVFANLVKDYLKGRGFVDNDFIKYDIGYCTTGEYENRFIIPSYDEDNQLNFFVSRTFLGESNSQSPYRNSDVSKDIIFFENLINWKQPIILCEGPLDAIAIRRNAIPILGKNISNRLLKKIIVKNVKDIYIALDKDALKKAIEYCEQFINLGKRVYLVNMEDKDPSKMGFNAFTKHIQTIQELDLVSLLKYKMII